MLTHVWQPVHVQVAGRVEGASDDLFAAVDAVQELDAAGPHQLTAEGVDIIMQVPAPTFSLPIFGSWS
jgi:hypothetical protein